MINIFACVIAFIRIKISFEIYDELIIVKDEKYLLSLHLRFAPNSFIEFIPQGASRGVARTHHRYLMGPSYASG